MTIVTKMRSAPTVVLGSDGEVVMRKNENVLTILGCFSLDKTVASFLKSSVAVASLNMTQYDSFTATGQPWNDPL